MRAAARDGSIEQLLEWHAVKPGDFFYIPANTVHAIGAGVSLIEIQQNSDITYRLYDYGRPRELHLDAGIAVAKGEPHAADLRMTLPDRGAVNLVDGPLFRLDRLNGPADAAMGGRYESGPLLVVPLSGQVAIGTDTIAPGECGLAKMLSDLTVPNGTLCLIAQDCS
jgi:mannose-6-phosphate isomerase